MARSSRRPQGWKLNGPAVRAIREAHGLNASTVADSIGISRGYYSRLESGEKQASAETAKAIADRLKVKLDAVTVVTDVGDAA